MYIEKYIFKKNTTCDTENVSDTSNFFIQYLLLHGEFQVLSSEFLVPCTLNNIEELLPEFLTHGANHLLTENITYTKINELASLSRASKNLRKFMEVSTNGM